MFVQILDIIDCTGSGDIDTSTVLTADDTGCIQGASGRKLALNPDWQNPSGQWHVGCRRLFELFPKLLTVSAVVSKGQAGRRTRPDIRMQACPLCQSSPVAPVNWHAGACERQHKKGL